MVDNKVVVYIVWLDNKVVVYIGWLARQWLLPNIAYLIRHRSDNCLSSSDVQTMTI